MSDIQPEIRRVDLRRIIPFVLGEVDGGERRREVDIIDFFDDLLIEPVHVGYRSEIVESTLYLVAADANSSTGFAITQRLTSVLEGLLDPGYFSDDDDGEKRSTVTGNINKVLLRSGVQLIHAGSTGEVKLVRLDDSSVIDGGKAGPQLVDLAELGFKVVKPTAFHVPRLRHSTKPLCGVLMPFDATMNEIYDEDIRPTCESAGYVVERADDIWKYEKVMDDVVDIIFNANVIVADLTGKNANVFYELGIAHLHGTVVIPIVQNKSDVPFDIQSDRYLLYEGTATGRRRLRRELKKRLDQITESH